MKLPFELPFGKKIKSEYFLGLILKDEKITAVVFEEQNKILRIVKEHHEYLKEPLEHTSYDTLLETIDIALSSAEESLPEGIETEKTIFGLKPDWVEDSQIKKDHLSVLKKMCDTLGFSPIGFLVIPEATAHLLGKEEGVPLSAILLDIGKKNLEISIVRAGKVLETKKTHIEDSIPKTTDRMLHHFTNQEILPSRIVIFDGHENSNIQQEFIAFSWSKSLPFLHVPQITLLSKQYGAKAILYGAATQMNFDIQDSHVPVQSHTAHQSMHAMNVDDNAIEAEPQQINDSAELIDHSVASPKQTTNAFGFVVNGDIEDISDSKHSKSLLEKTTQHHEEPKTKESITNFETIEDTNTYKGGSFAAKAQAALLSALTLFSFVMNHAKTIPLPHLAVSGNKKPLFIGGALLAGIAGLFVLYISMVSATVTVYLSPKIIEKTETITFSPEQPTDENAKIIFTQTVSVEKEGSLATNTTGIKEVGEKAKGNVTIYNSSLSEPRSFPKGTVITAPNGIQFLLDTSVQIASASGDAASITSSTAKANVVAKDIGKESNLPSGTKFTIGSIASTSVIAKNDAPFNGGSKKEVTVVAQKDIDKLVTQLPKNLEEEAKNEIMKKVSDDKNVLDGHFATKLTKKEFDKDLLEEAKTLNLKATIEFIGLTYATEELNKLFTSLLKDNQSSVDIAPQTISYDTKNTKVGKNGEVLGDITFRGGLVPKLNPDDLKKDLQGKSFEEAKAKLTSIAQVESVDIQLSPIPFLPKYLPRMEKNITVVIKTNE